jgi:exonuclease SbcC
LKKEKNELISKLVLNQKDITEAKLRQVEINANYSEDAFNLKNGKMIELVDALGRLEIELIAKRKEESELMIKLSGVEKDILILQGMQDRSTLLASVMQTSKAVRSVLNDAGPLVAQRYREVVSDIANSIFCSIHEERAELSWKENYLVTLHDHRGEREFNQLSGGEQMTAALAVQLALAKEFPKLGVAMFDEPTTNMDKERRGELAKIIGRIKETYGFEQLFVISHDEAFETMTEQIIRLEKEDGTTKLVEEM